MNEHNQNSQNETSTNSSSRKEHGFFTKARAIFAGALLIGGSTALGAGFTHANSAPDNHGTEPTPASAPVTPGSDEALDNAKIEPGTILTAKPTPTEAPTPTVVETPTPAAQTSHEPTNNSQPTAEPTTAPSETIIVDDSGMMPTDSPSPENNGDTVIVDDSGMMPTDGPIKQ